MSNVGINRVLLITMPLADPLLPNLAIEQLASIARASGVLCDVLYGTLFLPRSIPTYMIHSISGPTIFTPFYFDIDPEQVATEVADEIIQQKINNVSQDFNQEEFRELVVFEYMMAMEDAEKCLERCMTAIPEGKYDIIGFSVGFDAQKLASGALARRLKKREPTLHIIFGGTGCDGDMGLAMMEMFPQIDAIIQGEAEKNFLPVISALRGQNELDSLKNCLYRNDDTIIETKPDEPISELDVIPDPNYLSFLKQRANSSYENSELVLLFETSRGCWWGKKSHCLFCGIQAVGMSYRRRSTYNALEQILSIYRKYKPDLLYSTDAILDYKYFATVLPELARLRRQYSLGLTLFYETKSNLRRQDVALLAAAGVKRIQPGIENFSSNVLRLMKKGAEGLQQLLLLKWAKSYDISVVYGLLIGTPGETIEDYKEMIDLFNKIHHLPPPVQVNRLGLHKFSPYSEDPKSYGLTNIRPFQFQRIAYRSSDDHLLCLCYELEYTLEKQETSNTVTIRKYLSIAVERWRNAYLSGERMTLSENADGNLVIINRKANGELKLRWLKGLEAEVYRCCENINTIDRIAQHLKKDISLINSVVKLLENENLIVVKDKKCLALALLTAVDAWFDSGLEGQQKAVFK